MITDDNQKGMMAAIQNGRIDKPVKGSSYVHHGK